jgi:dipeptidyl aminopeptidase/acylaminoacyl peptidase
MARRRIQIASWLALAAACAAQGAAAAPAGGVDKYLQVPFPSQLVSAAGSEGLAWIGNDRGVRNVWTASPPHYTPTLLTHESGDDGIDLSGLRMSRSGSTLVWVRGGHPGESGFSQNPESLPGGIEQWIWITSAGSPPRELVKGDLPVISPDGQVILYRQGETLGCVSATSAAAPGWCKAPLLKLRGDNGRPVFSPDGKRIAFVSDRKDHSFIGVLDTVDRRVTWMAPDVGRDDFPAWSPDGTRVAFLRISGVRFGETLDITGAWPFEIWSADARTGQGARLFRSNATAGGFAQFDNEGPSREPLRWSPANQLLFYSEESGWIHLYSMRADGGSVRDLTPGHCEVESDALAADGRSLIVSSNCADIDGRQLSLISIVGGEREMLPGRGIDVEPVFIGTTQSYAYRSADAKQPLSIVVALTPTRREAIYPSIPSGFPLKALVKPESVVFRSTDGMEIHGQLFRPAAGGNLKSKHAAVIFVHGGPVRQMLPGWHYMDYYNNSYAMNQYLASRGFTVLSVNFRSGIGYGQAFRRAKDQGPRGTSEFQDVLAAREYLAGLPDVDAARIGIYGGSYGGLLTAMALSRRSDLFAAGVDFHGVHDWAHKAQEKDLPGAGWGIDASLYDLAYRSSPVATASAWRSPVLFIHGDDDSSVPFNQTIDLVERLRQGGVPVETLIFPDEEHGFLRYATWVRAYESTADFLSRRLSALDATH